MTIPPIRLPLPTGLTHHETLIVMWIGFDPPLLAELRCIALGSDYVAGDVQLSTLVSDLLYSRSYHYSLPDLYHVTAHDGDAAKAHRLRISVPERAFHDIDLEGWARICGALLAGLPLPEELS